MQCSKFKELVYEVDMVKHIVFFRFNRELNSAKKQAYAKEIKQRLESLVGLIPEILTIEVGINYNATESSSDFALYSEFDNRNDLEKYQAHPEHLAVVPFVNSLIEERRVVDYEF
tara:strand:- start:428 stop:772 length:345 start_codon:yes stop_codon:yes gene_type:complete